MYSFLLAIAFVCSCLNNFHIEASQQEIVSTLREFPLTVEEVVSYKTAAIQELHSSLAAYKAQSKDKLNFDGIVVRWHKLIESFFAKKTVLSFTFLISEDVNVQSIAKKEAEEMKDQLQKACLDADALALYLEFASQAATSPDTLSLSEKYWLYTVISGVVEARAEMDLFKQKAITLQNLFANHAMVPFTYIKGELEEKIFSSERQVSVLNWNVCFFNHGLSMLFGGVLPWKDRIENVVEKIQSSGADLICLQEVFSQEAAVELQHLLRKNYSHFYINIGPKLCGFDPNALGIPSGLFVASKYPLKEPHFQAFNHKETPKNRGYGFFIVDLMDKGNLVARVTSTHLQPGQGEDDKSYRVAQLNAILSNLRTKDTLDTPCFLCGDLNLEKGSDEYTKLLQNFVSSDASSDWTCCELRNYWWKAGQDVKKFISFGLDVEWIDYFLQLKSGMQASSSMATEILSVNNLKDPKNSLSDHQILMTTFKLKNKK
ncbi:MAG: endonuclease/exonuclease/phosphatase family protein [Chlamydiota bacterium]